VSLNAGHNGLESIPDSLPPTLVNLSLDHNLIEEATKLPPRLESLDLSHNRLKNIHLLPDTLERIDLSGNRLERISAPMPRRLHALDVSDNFLRTLPQDLPIGTADVNAADNLLTALPESLPRTLDSLDVSRNYLATLPDDIEDLVLTDIKVSGNFIPRAMADEPPPTQFSPRIHIDNSAAAFPAREASKSTTEAALRWLDGQPEDVLMRWGRIGPQIENMNGAAEFRHFLDRLRKTRTYSDKESRQDMVNWLKDLSSPQRTSLRRATLDLCTQPGPAGRERMDWLYGELRAARMRDDTASGNS
jgi:large subunit ribosomal protein L30/E3 ubiquitin-protein ligase SspH2